MKTKMILKKGIVFLFAIMMALTGIFSLGVMAASGLEGAYISPKSKMGLEFANNFDRSVSKSQVSVPNFMADSDTNSEEPNKSFNAQQVAAGNSDAGAKWRGFAAYAKNHDPEDFWVRYKDVTTVGGKSVDLKIEVTDWKTQNDESKPLPSSADMFGHDNNSAHLGYAIGFSYKKTGVVMFSGFKWVKFKYTFLYNGTNTKAPFTGFATFQDIDQNQYVTITDGMDNIVNTSYIGGSDGNTWCEPDGWTYKAIKDQNASSDQDSFDKTCISLYVKDMTDMSIKYGWTGHTAIAYFDLAPWAMNSFEENKNPDVPKKLIQNGGSWISNEKTSAVNYELGDTYSYRYEDSIPDYASDTLEKLRNQSQTAVSSYVWEDAIDDGLSYVSNSLQVNVGGQDFTSKFTDSSSGQYLKFSAKTDALSNTAFYGKKVTITFKVKIKDASYSWLGHERTSNNKYRLIPNAAKRSMKYLKKLTYDSKNKMYDVTDGDYGFASQDTSTVWSKVPIGDPNNPDPDPKKTVSDDDEKNVLSNTLTNADETFTYTVSKEIEKNMPSTAKYSKFVIKDAVDSCLTIDSVKFYAGDKDVTSSFAPASANKGNYLEYAASSDLLNNKDFYGNNAGTTVKMVVKTHIDAKKVSIETLRAHGHLVENDKKTETDIKIKNETTVTTTKADNQGTWDVDKKVTPPPTTTDSPVPSIKDPVKKVSDSDDLNWDATVKQDGEKTPGSHNRVTDVTNQWLYTLTQEIPAHTVELFHYKSFTITDAVDSCLSYDVKDITIKAGDKDYTDKFDVTKGEDNSITLTAKADVLTSDEFYGGNAGNKIVVSFPVKISADAETLKDENLGHLEIDGKKLAHLQKVSDLQKLSGFTDLVKSKDNEYVYAFLNQAKTHIDSQIKYEGQTGVKDRSTDKVQTAVETADPTIKKESSKYEWQVGDKVDYTINVGDANSNSIADNVVITDESLPKAMLPDKDSITISSTFDKEKSGAPEDRDISKDAKIEYTEKGFVITIPKLYRGEAATIKLTCTAKEKSTYDSITDQWADCLEKANADKKLTCVNGEVIENRAYVTATLMLKDKDNPPDDLERVWVNTPHLNIKKSVEKKEYNVGETVKYTLVVTNVHEGTLARDIVITDQLQTPGETIVEGTIRLKDETGAVYDLGKKAGKDAEKPYLETQDDTSFKITTGMNLRYDGESPFKKLAEIDDKVHWKNKEGLTQEGWDAPITHTKFTVTYEAKINKEPADTNQFVNVATAKGSNTDEVKDDEIVYLKTPVIKTEKESDKDSYQKGETAKYHLTVTQTREDRTAVNVVIKDALKDEDSEKERIKGDTIKVYYNGNEFTPVSVKSDDTSFTIETGKNLTVKDKLEVTYDAEILSDLNKDSITNIVKAKADNAYAEIELDVPVTKVTQNISARKTSNPASGTVVKQGGQIIYYIDVHNDSETTLKNVLVRDAIPELSNYVDGSASNDGKIMEINGKQYITYIIDIDIPSLGLGVEGNPEKKTALFLVMPSGDSSYNLFINMFYTQLFTVLKRIADDRRDGQLPIHVRLWADEYYAGPKPLNCETLLGEIRSRNMSIVPILQDIAQIKTLYPNDKWEIFTGNCATTVFLGSGATAHTTHQWISDMLEDMTIDSRSENLGHSQGGGNLQMSKGGMKLMTPGQVSRMPKNDCILFLKGERPIYDKKNWSFDTEVFKEAQEIAGKNGYKNPVYVSYDEENRQYATTRFESRLNYISQEDYEFYEEKAKTDDNIQTFQIDEDAFLYLNFNETPQPSLRELEKMVKKIQVSENSEDDENEEDEKKEDTVQDRKKWDLSGDIMDCFQRYSSELSQEEQEEIIKGIEDGLTDQEIKRYFALYGADKMQQYRRVLTARKNRG